MSYIEKVLILFLSIIIINSIYHCNAYGQSAIEIDDYCNDVAGFYQIPYEILPAIIRVESDYMQSAVSCKNAYGLMQITEPAFIDYLKRNPNTWITNFNIVKTNWKANIAVGANHLVKLCYKEKRNWKCAITSYFWGINHTNTTEKYYNKVKDKMK